MSLIHRTADGLGELMGQHLKLARLELAIDLRAMSHRAGVLVVLASVTIVGYALAMAGLAVLIGGHATVGVPLLVMGLGHVVVCGAGLLLTMGRLRRMQLMDASADAAGRSLATLGVAPEPERLVPHAGEKTDVR